METFSKRKGGIYLYIHNSPKHVVYTVGKIGQYICVS